MLIFQILIGNIAEARIEAIKRVIREKVSIVSPKMLSRIRIQVIHPKEMYIFPVHDYIINGEDDNTVLIIVLHDGYAFGSEQEDNQFYCDMVSQEITVSLYHIGYNAVIGFLMLQHVSSYNI